MVYIPQTLTIDQILSDELNNPKPKVESTFDSQEITALGTGQLQVLLQTNHANWELSPDLSFTKFLKKVTTDPQAKTGEYLPTRRFGVRDRREMAPH